MRTEILAALIFLVGVDVGAQPVKRIVLSPPNSTLTAEFVGITSIREIADGRVLVTDGRDQTLYLADFRANTAVVLGSKGKGPGEYVELGMLHAITGDSTIMRDMITRRWLLFDGARIVATIPPDHPAIKATESTIDGADGLGHVMRRRPMPERNGVTQITRNDSISVTLVDRKSGRTDTIAKLREMPLERIVNMDKDGHIHGAYSKATEENAQKEQAFLTPDGWLAVIRVEPLRVDWRSPAGTWTKGPPLPLKPAVIDARERKVIQQRYAAYITEMKKIGFPVAQQAEIPKTMKVFATYRHLYSTHDGRLAVKRASSAASSEYRWIIINRRGTIDGEFVIGANEDIAGFGNKSLYIIRKDDNDIQTLQRHPWP